MSRNTASTGDTDTFETGEFVEIEYTARIADDGTVVDTTDPSVATESGLAGIDASGPVVVILGEGHVFGPIEDALTEMQPSEQRTVEVSPTNAFGEMNPTRRVSIPVQGFSEDSIEQNDRVTINGRAGYVDAVEDGTATIDFNHPLAGSTLEYEIRPLNRIVDLEDRTEGLLRLYGLRDDVTYVANDDVVECSATRSSVPGEEWYDRKRQFLEAATNHLAVDEIRFEERYATE